MAGYSGTPLPKKLGIKDGSRVALVGAPAGLVPAIADGADVLNSGVADVLVCFVDTVDEVSQRLAELKPRLEWDGGLWFAWCKRRPGFTPTLDENTIRKFGLAAGFVDNKVCAIDEEWSGLRFVWRLADRPAKAKSAKVVRV
jgi:hypothetical protein